MKMARLLLSALLMIPSVAVADANISLLPTSQFADWYYQNPSAINGIGDPHILEAEGAYWCYATSSGTGFKVWRSEDLVNWVEQKKLCYKMSRTGWGDAQFWAPEVYEREGRYYLFYSAKVKRQKTLRIGVAVADHPAGPFVDVSDGPFFDPGYAVIDASFFVDDDGAMYLYYSRDCSEHVVDGVHRSDVYGVRLKDDLSGTDGDPVPLTSPDQAWEMFSGPEWLWNEGPIVRKHEGAYLLFYSANYFAGKEYGVGAARSEGPLGPFEKLDRNPLLTWAEAGGALAVSGPGHNSFLATHGEDFMVYHTHTNLIEPSGDRQMALDRAGFHADGTPYVNGPTTWPQLKPLQMLGLRNLALEAQGEATLMDGDYGVSPASAGYGWKGRSTMLTWAAPVTARAVVLYPAQGAAGKGRIVIDGEKVIQVDFAELSDQPGASLRYHFEGTEMAEMRLEFDGDVGLHEVLVIG